MSRRTSEEIQNTVDEAKALIKDQGLTVKDALSRVKLNASLFYKHKNKRKTYSMRVKRTPTETTVFKPIQLVSGNKTLILLTNDEKTILSAIAEFMRGAP